MSSRYEFLTGEQTYVFGPPLFWKDIHLQCLISVRIDLVCRMMHKVAIPLVKFFLNNLYLAKSK